MNRRSRRPGPKATRRRRRIERLKAEATVEHSRRYQRLLRRAAALSQAFQERLDTTQLGAWLSLEEALLEFATYSNEAFFEAGLVIGRRQHRGRAGADVVGRRGQSDPELARNLVRLIRIIARR